MIRPRLTVELNLDTLGQLPNDGTRAALIAMFRRQQEATGVDRQWHREKLRRQYIRAHWRDIPWIAATLAAAEQHRREAAADRHAHLATEVDQARKEAQAALEKP